MKLLIHHSNLVHDFVPEWRLKELNWSKLITETGYHGYTWSDRLPAPTKAPEIMFAFHALLNEPFEPRLSSLAACGAKTIALTDISHERLKTNAPTFNPNDSLLSTTELETLAQKVDEAAQAAHRLGLTLVYRPHLATSVQNLEDLEKFAAHARIPLQIDLAHLAFLKMFSMRDVLEQYGPRLHSVILQDYNPCAWVNVRQNALPYTDALRANVFQHPANRGVKVDWLLPFREQLKYGIVLGERAPSEQETIAALKSSRAHIEAALKPKVA